MKTLKFITDFLSDTANLPHDLSIEDELESKKQMKQTFKKHFQWLRDKKEVNPLLAFQVLAHRLKEIASIAKEVFYDDAKDWVKAHDPDAEGKFFGTKVTTRISEDYEYIPSPKMRKLEKEMEDLEKKHKPAIKAYEAYQTDINSLKNQLKEEKKRLVEKGMAKKKSESVTLVLKY